MGENKSTDRVLVITPKPPYPPVDGGAMAMANLIDMLRMEFEQVDLFCLYTPKHPLVPEKFPAELHYTAAYADTSVRLQHAPRAVLGSKSYRVSRFYAAQADAALTALLKKQQYRYIILESPYVSPYIDTVRRHSKARICLRVHNLEYRIWENIIHTEKNPLKKKWLKAENRRLQRLEEKLFSSVDGLICISAYDWDEISSTASHAPGIVVPFTLAPQAVLPPANIENTGPLHLFHIGAMDWSPNQEAMHWFLTTVFPAMRIANPGLQFHMAGKSMSREFLSWQQDHVTVHGEVKDAARFMQQFDLMVVPLLSGSGIRIKIMEALMLGIPVLSTSLGISGLDLEAGEEVLVADTLDDFRQLARRLGNDRDFLSELGKKGQQKMLAAYALDKYAAILHRFLVNLGT